MIKHVALDRKIMYAIPSAAPGTGIGCDEQMQGSPVARYDKELKQATRQRILDTAGRRFKTDGIDG